MDVKYIFYNIRKKLRYGLSNHAGRNFRGIICVHHRGGVIKNVVYILILFVV